MNGVEVKSVSTSEAGLRLDRWFKTHYPVLPHGRLEKLLRTGKIRVDGACAKSSTRLQTGQQVRIPPLKDAPLARRLANVQQELSSGDKAFIESLVIYSDNNVIALNKPPGLAVQGGSATRRHIDGLIAALNPSGEKPRLVHRLDKATSGVLLLARSRNAAAALGRALKYRDAKKIYWALVVGVPSPQAGEIDAPLAKSGGAGRERMGVAGRGGGAKSAHTLYRVIETAAAELAWVALAPLTGRTHQLRVHMAVIGHPIAGDGKYGGARAYQSGVGGGLHLHARSIAIPHPSGGWLEITAPLPEHMAESWKLLGFEEIPSDPFADWQRA